MKCPNCGNQKYERLDYAIVRCTNCYSLWDPFVYPGFPELTVDIGEIWDTSLSSSSNLYYGLDAFDEDPDEWDEEDDDEYDENDEWEDEDYNDEDYDDEDELDEDDTDWRS